MPSPLIFLVVCLYYFIHYLLKVVLSEMGIGVTLVGTRGKGK